MKKLKVVTNRYMDPEEFEILKQIHRGLIKNNRDLAERDNANPGFMADFGLLSASGYCGWLNDGTVVLTKQGLSAVEDDDDC